MKRLLLLLTLLIAGITANAQFSPSNNLNYVKLLKDPPVATKNDSVVMFDGTDKFLKMMPVSELVDNTAIYLELAKKQFLSTGLIKNGMISINGDPTKFNITAGIGIISNFDNPEIPVSTIVNFGPFTGITPTYLTTGNITYLAVNSGGVLVQQATEFTTSQRRDLILLGAVVHSNLTTINVVNNISAPTNADTNQLHDLMTYVGPLNLDGNKYTANGANLALNKSAGTIFKYGVNFANDWKKPHELSQALQTALTFRYRTQNGTEGSDRINLDPALYDLNNVLTSVPNNKFTIQTVTMFQTGLTRVQYGQNVYDDLASAERAIFTRDFTVENNIKTNGVARAYVIMRNTTTSLQNTADAKIIEIQKYGGVASGGVALTLASIVDALGYTPANDADVVHKYSTPETKIGSLTLGENSTHPNDIWIALGTSVTYQGFYTEPMRKQLGVTINNLGTTSSNSSDIVNKYASIPILTSGNIDSYRLLSFEYGINDVLQGVSVATYRTNLENGILHAKGKGWANNKILIINSNYCSTVSLDNELEAYANEAILVAKEQGVQYVDVYNYTKNNGGGALTNDGVHPNEAGGIVYARGATSLMQGGLEISSALNVINGVISKSLKTYEDCDIAGLTLGRGNGNILFNTVFGYQALYSNTTGALNTPTGYNSLKFNTTGDNNTATGALSLVANTTGDNNSANGYAAMFNNVSGRFNTANGTQSIFDNVSGENNTANGYQSLLRNLSSNNTASGAYSLLFNTYGTSNVANGYQANLLNTTGSFNTTGGAMSLFSNTTGSRNVVNGYEALRNNVAGNDNVSDGYLAGSFFNVSSPLTNPSSSIFIGSESRALADNGTNEIVIGTNVIGQGSNSTSIGNSSTTTAKIYGNIVSPDFTGIPTAPTATIGTNTTQLATTAFVLANTGSTPVQLKDFYSDSGNTNTTETDLLFYTVAANRFNATAEKIISNFAGTFNDITASSQLKLYFAGNLIGDTGVLTMSVTGAWVTTISIIRTGTTTARAVVNVSTPGASTASYTKYTSLTGLSFTGTNLIKITGTASGATASDGDIVATYGNIIWQPAAL